MGLPQIKKKIASFIKDEEGKISKQSLLALGTFIGTAAIASVLSSKSTSANAITLSNSTVGNTVSVTASHTHHGSHSSHGSHGSHGSHSSHSSWFCHASGYCISVNTLISTPKGEISVEKLESGMTVWTQDNAGKRFSVEIMKVANTLAPKDHKILFIKLKDGRQVRISPKHPLADGRLAEQLIIGENYDGSIIDALNLETYKGIRTYDLLPKSETGYYWANGILMGSTLKKA